MITTRSTVQYLLTLLVVGTGLFVTNSCGTLEDHKVPDPAGFTAELFYGSLPSSRSTGENLKSPIGLTVGKGEVLFVTENGTGANDGMVSAITPGGVKYPVITGLHSSTGVEGSPEGLAHLKYKDGWLYILQGVDGILYTYDVSGFVPGVTPAVNASVLGAGENIGAFVKMQGYKTPAETDPYNLTFGPDGDLFIADAAGNAIVRRNKMTKTLSIYATIPSYPGPPVIDAVPTGIVYDGTNFYVSTLSGFPFPSGVAKIFKITPNGATGTVSEYKSGFTGMTDLVLTPGGKLIATEFGFSGMGRIANESAVTLPLDPALPVITPIDIELSNANADTYYLLCYGTGVIYKLKGKGL
ncbi:hypothetical protein GCM10028803_44710 [Larkinella knui]|uniref:ScyD/ScyE family protein n=1 Tax=Larkinella knui TaxID=2025310 RepID=A0A3P1CPE6_9BACT|nr:ScyD/ScyE family protein [Larkinella knui]RRB15080.1 ScyD/ScyE family protein [Larkinella knui]